MKKNVFRAFGLALVAMLAFIGCAGTVPRPPSAAGTSGIVPGKIEQGADGVQRLYVTGAVEVVDDAAPRFVPKNQDPRYGVLWNRDLAARLDIEVFRRDPQTAREQLFLRLVMEPGAALFTNIFPEGTYRLIIFAYRQRLWGYDTLGRHSASVTVTEDPQRFTWPPGRREGIAYVGWITELSGFSDPALTAPTGPLQFHPVLDFSKIGGDFARWLTCKIYGGPGC
ncbi:hypothetical protein HYW30_00020 [Candidatus Azambacteria bacterium]|nr:hypothetical protein [Candidatus Azambacteria bacterium]